MWFIQFMLFVVVVVLVLRWEGNRALDAHIKQLREQGWYDEEDC